MYLHVQTGSRFEDIDLKIDARVFTQPFYQIQLLQCSYLNFAHGLVRTLLQFYCIKDVNQLLTYLSSKLSCSFTHSLQSLVQRSTGCGLLLSCCLQRQQELNTYKTAFEHRLLQSPGVKNRWDG